MTKQNLLVVLRSYLIGQYQCHLLKIVIKVLELVMVQTLLRFLNTNLHSFRLFLQTRKKLRVKGVQVANGTRISRLLKIREFD